MAVDHAKASIDGILNGPEFVRIPNVELFPEHELKDRSGKIVRKVGEEKLRAAAKTAIERYRKTGDLSPIGAGHTFDDEFEIKDGKPRLVRKFPETQQPAIWGYIGPDQEVKTRADGKKALYSSVYMRREIEFQDGDRLRKITGQQALAEFPRRSPEYYQGEDRLSYLALLRREPKLDMGLTVYAKAHPDQAFFIGNQFAAVSPTFGPTRYTMGVDEMIPTAGPARYENPTQEPAATPEPAAGAETGGWGPEHEEFAQHLLGMPHENAKKLLGHLATKYGAECGLTPAAPAAPAGPAVPAAPHASAPAAAPHPEHTRMEKDQAEIEKARYAKQMADLEARVRNAEYRETAARYERELQGLIFQHYDLDLQDEMRFVCPDGKPPIAQADFDTHVAQIKRYQRDRQIITDPEPIDRYDRATGQVRVPKSKDDPDNWDEEKVAEVNRYAAAEGCSWADAVKHYQMNGAAK